jgi:hypothetical protein
MELMRADLAQKCSQIEDFQVPFGYNTKR